MIKPTYEDVEHLDEPEVRLTYSAMRSDELRRLVNFKWARTEDIPDPGSMTNDELALIVAYTRKQCDLAHPMCADWQLKERLVPEMVRRLEQEACSPKSEESAP